MKRVRCTVDRSIEGIVIGQEQEGLILLVQMDDGTVVHLPAADCEDL